MVDVGYFINGKHGVIRNVSLTANPYSDHRVFTSADCAEQYCMKVDDIEYIIPHEEENTMIIGDKDGWYESPYTEEKMIELCQKVDPPITFAEKFKEVFGFEPDKYKSMCDIINCNCKDSCQGCLYENWDWDVPYICVKSEVKD